MRLVLGPFDSVKGWSLIRPVVVSAPKLPESGMGASGAQADRAIHILGEAGVLSPTGKSGIAFGRA